MIDNIFSHKNYFSYDGLYSDLFQGTANLWDIVSNIDSFMDRFKNNLPNDFSKVKENVFVGPGVKIDDSAKIEGIAIIGSNSVIGHAAYIRGGVLIGENVNIGHAVEVKHSVILDGSAIAHLNYVGDSIIGSNVNIGGGSILANWRFDEKNISIKLNHQKTDTGLKKLGSIVGDNSKIGVNAVLNPGTILGKDCSVYPLKSVSGVYANDSKIKE